MIERLIYKFKKIMIDSSSIHHSGNSLKKILDDINIYSNEEKKVGIWTNGKPIYRKVINLEVINGNISISNLNIDNLIKFECMFKVSLPNGQKQWRNLPWVYAGGNAYGNAEYVGGVTLVTEPTCYLVFQSGNAFVNYFEKGHIVLEYTKTD